MGIADEIVNLAFLLTFGAVAVAVALSFGLGGREAPEGRWKLAGEVPKGCVSGSAVHSAAQARLLRVNVAA